jgi:hypothetical protein
MKKSEKLLREQIKEIKEYGEQGNHWIRYNDALKAVEKALDSVNLFTPKEWNEDISDWLPKTSANPTVSEMVFDIDTGMLKVDNDSIDRSNVDVLLAKTKSRIEKKGMWWTYECIGKYKAHYIYFKFKEANSPSIELQPYTISKEYAEYLMKEWVKNGAGWLV